MVRINPDEVHLNDPENFDRIYHVGSKYSKSPNLYNALCVPLSTFGTISNDAHRIRRAALNPMFSRKMVLELESLVHDKADKVCRLMQQGLDHDTPVDLHHIFRSVSVDVISDFAFHKSYDLLDEPDTGAYFFRMVRGIGPALYVFQQLPSFQSLALKTPPWLAPYLSEPLGYVTGFQQERGKQARKVKQRMAEGKLGDRPTIFSTLLDPEDKPKGYQIPNDDVMIQEAYSLLGAAADTTGNAMTVAAFNVLRNPQTYQKLAQELEKKFSDPEAKLEFVELEKIPYLVRKQPFPNSYWITTSFAISLLPF